MLATSVRLWEENLQWKVRKVKPTKVERERHYHFHTTFGEAKPHWYTTSRPATGHLASKYPVGLCHKTCTIKIHQSIERPSTSASRHYLTHTHLQGAFITVLELGKMQCNMYTSQHGHRQNFVLRRANPLYEGEEGGGAGQLCWGGWGGGGASAPFAPPCQRPCITVSILEAIGTNLLSQNSPRTLDHFTFTSWQWQWNSDQRVIQPCRHQLSELMKLVYLLQQPDNFIIKEANKKCFC